MVMETTDSCRSALTTLSTTLVFPDAVPPATPMKKGSCLGLGICMPATAGKQTTAARRTAMRESCHHGATRMGGVRKCVCQFKDLGSSTPVGEVEYATFLTRQVSTYIQTGLRGVIQRTISSLRRCRYGARAGRGP